MLSRNLVLEEENKETIQERMGRDLAGFRLDKGYCLKVGDYPDFFPAIIKETKEIVVFLDKNILEELKTIFPKVKAQIKKVLLLINEKESFAFDVTVLEKNEKNKLQILTKKEFENLKNEKNSFRSS